MQELPRFDVRDDVAALPVDFRQTLVYQTIGSPAQIQQDLLGLQSLDREAERKRVIWTMLTIASAAFTVFCLLKLILSGVPDPLVSTCLVLGVAGTVATGIMSAKYRRLDLDNRRYRLTREVMRYLAADMMPGRMLDIKIDFNSYQNQRYQTGGSSAGTLYAVPWLAMKGTLADGNRFRLSVTQIVKRKSRAKRKYTKVREAFREKIQLAIRPRRGRYTGLERMKDLIRSATLPAGLQRMNAACSAERIAIVAVTDCHRRVKGRYGVEGQDADQLTSDQHSILGLFIACYHCLGKCRVRRKGV